MVFPAPLLRHLSKYLIHKLPDIISTSTYHINSAADVGSQQVVARDQKSIICYHPPTNVSYQHTKVWLTHTVIVRIVCWFVFPAAQKTEGLGKTFTDRRRGVAYSIMLLLCFL